LTPEQTARGHVGNIAVAVRSGEATGAFGAGVDDVGLAAVVDRDRVYRRSLVLADAVAALAAIYVALTVVGDDRLQWAALLTIPLAVLVSKVLGLYDRDELLIRKTTLDESPALFQLAAMYTLLIWLLENAVVDGALGHSQALGLWLCLFAFALGGRTFARGMARRLATEERCLVLGDREGTGTIERKIAAGRGMKARVVAHLPADLDAEYGSELRLLEVAIAEHDIHRVILAPRSADSDAMLDAVRLVKSLGVKVSLLPRLLEVVGSSVVFDDLDGVTVLGVRRFGMTRSSAIVKRCMDLLGGSVALLVAGPAMVVIAVAIRLDSRGPLFFRQVRVGRDGKQFLMLKFRTMVDGADALKPQLEHASGGRLFKLPDDPRVTRVGRWLRRTSLDELPQLVNVLRGDMSLVGPRPLVIDEDRLVLGWHRRRLHLMPGMTGHWQILGSARIPLAEMVKIDYLYAANWSLWTDVKILLRTIPYMVRGGSM
jgi:exopolysaccharide biosynthesis polyprenyl glycosylphosphotransferase